MDIANLVIRVTNDGLTAAQRELRRLRDEVNRNVDANAKMKQGLDDLSKWAAIGLGALGGTMAVATKKAMSFESAMAEVNKTVDFAASDGLAKMQKQLEGLTKEIPQSFEELAGVAAVAGQLGIAEKDIVGFTETIAKMGVAFDISSADAADSMAKIANVFELPIENIGQLGDTINTLSNNMASTAPNIIEFMKRSAALAKIFKLTTDDTAAFGSALVALGWQPEVASTAFNSMIMTLSDLDGLSKSGIIGLQQLGLDTLEFANLAKTDGKGAILEVIAAVNKLDESSRIAALSNLFGKEAAAKIASMATGIDTVNAALEATTDTAGSMQKEVEVISATTANKMQLFKNNIDLAVKSLGEAFIPMLNEMLISMTPIIDKITAWVEANPELVRQITLITASVLASIIGIKLFADGVAAAITTIDNLKTAFGLVRTSLTILTGGFALPLLAIAALIAAGVLLYQNWDLVKEKASELNEWVKEKFGSLPEPLQQAGRDIAQVFMAIWDTGREYLTLMGELYSGTFESFATIATGVFQAVWSVIKVSFSGIVNTVSTALQLVATLFSGGFALIKNTVSTVLGVIKAVISGDFKAIPGIIGNGLKAAAGIVSNMMSGILNIIINYGKRLYSIGKDFIQGFINGIKSVSSGVASAATTMVGNAIAAVKKRQDSASPSKVTTKLGGDFSQGMANGIKKGVKVVKTEAQRMAEQAIDAVKNSIATLQKEIALFGNNNELTSFDFDVSVGKFAGVSPAMLNKNRDLIIQKQTLIDLDKRQAESERSLAKAREAIQSRFDKMNEYKESTKTDLQGVLSGIENEDPLTKLQNQYEDRMSVIEKYEQMHTDMIGVQTEARLAIEKSYMDAKRDLMLTQGEALFGSLAGLSKSFVGEQSATYRVLFGLQKAFALAQSVLAIKTSIAKATAMGVTPFDKAFYIGEAVATGASIISDLASTQAKGFKQGGYTGNMGASQVAGVVHGQEYVFDAQSTKRIGVDNLNAMRSGKAPTGDVSINIINNSSAKVTASDDGQTITIEDVNNAVDRGIKRSWTNTGNPNSFESKQLNRNLQAPRRR